MTTPASSAVVGPAFADPPVPLPRRRLTFGRLFTRFLSPGPLVESPFGAESAILTTLWASSLRRSRLETGQPYPSRLIPATENAVACIESVPRWQSSTTLVRWHGRLAQGDSVDVVEPGELSDYADELWALIVSAPGAATSEIYRWTRELAGVAQEREWYGPSLHGELQRVLAQERDHCGSTGTQIESLLFRAPTQHLVVIGLSGAREIVGLASMAAPNIRVMQDETTQASYSGWGQAGSKVKPFVDALTRPPAEIRDLPVAPVYSLLLEIAVTVPRIEAAAEDARRQALRLLDVVSAAHPSARLRLSELAGVGDPVSGRFHVHSFAGHVARSIELDQPAPSSSLASSIRAAALIRQLADPLTRASFSWIAFETAGLDNLNSLLCGRSLALVGARHLAIVAYRDAQRGVTEIGDTLRSYEQRGKSEARKARELRRARPKDQELIPSLLDRATAHEATAAEYARRAAESRLSYESAVSWIDQLGVSGPNLLFGQKGFSNLVAMASWQSQLADLADPGVTSPLAELLLLLPPWAAVSIRSCAAFFSDSTVMRDELESSARYFAKLLDGLYSARNVHLHSGLSDVPGASAIGAVAPLLIDTMTELFLHWQTEGSTAAPPEVVSELSARFDIAISAGPSAFDTASLTSP